MKKHVINQAILGYRFGKWVELRVAFAAGCEGSSEGLVKRSLDAVDTELRRTDWHILQMVMACL